LLTIVVIKLLITIEHKFSLKADKNFKSDKHKNSNYFAIAK